MSHATLIWQVGRGDNTPTRMCPVIFLR